MNTARFEFVAQRMAPRKEVINVEWQPNGSTVLLSCGHTWICVPHFHVKLGTTHNCRECGRIATRNLPEFNKT